MIETEKIRDLFREYADSSEEAGAVAAVHKAGEKALVYATGDVDQILLCIAVLIRGFSKKIGMDWVEVMADIQDLLDSIEDGEKNTGNSSHLLN